jgi:hypothetical protein
MCTGTTKATLFTRFLSKGTFPGFGSAELPYWFCLVELLEKDADGTVAEINTALKDPDDFSSVIEVNKVTVDLGLTDTVSFLGHAHARLCADHGQAKLPPRQTLIQRLRTVAEAKGMGASSVALTADPNTQMGHGLVANPLTYIPDVALGVRFGSVPDQVVIGAKAAIWQVLKRRAYEAKVLTQYGGKPHYVLAHLLNHNLNGPGNNELNVVPFWATANTEMSNKAEKYVKELVLRGAQVNYTIQQGAAVGLTPARQKLLADIDAMKPTDPPVGDRKVQRQLVEYEQHLPDSFVINCDALDDTGKWVNIVNNVRIENYVPLTVPYLL